ncbi:MAG: PQQ-binding-like beta-propeller repeat protein [Alphaproteobacteria bacterium]
MKQIGWILLGSCLILSACSDTKKIAPKEGRIAVIAAEEMAQSGEKIRLDKPSSVNQWIAPGANNRNKIPALSFTKAEGDWKVEAGKGRSQNDLPMVSPVLFNDVIYVLDNENHLFAKNTKDREEKWQADSETKMQGVGLTANKKWIVSVNENGQVSVFDAQGKNIWKKELNVPFRSTPLLNEEVLYLLSANNDLWVLDVKTGAEKWRYKTTEPLTLLQGMGRPALADDVLVVPFSTGEVIAFNAKTGVLLWIQDMVGEKAFDAIAGITQMNASPVIENGLVYLVGHGGKTMAVNLKTGKSLWQITKGGQTTPLISGNALFFVDNQNHLLALNKKSGKLFWETALETTVWKGPYLIEGKLVLFSDEKALLVNPKDGKITPLEKRMKGSAPALTNEGIFFLGDNGTIYHWGKI